MKDIKIETPCGDTVTVSTEGDHAILQVGSPAVIKGLSIYFKAAEARAMADAFLAAATEIEKWEAADEPKCQHLGVIAVEQGEDIVATCKCGATAHWPYEGECDSDDCDWPRCIGTGCPGPLGEGGPVQWESHHG